MKANTNTTAARAHKASATQFSPPIKLSGKWHFSSCLKAIAFLAMFFFNGMCWGQYSGTGVFTKITSLAELEDGYYVVAYGSSVAMNNTNTGTYFGNTSITVVDNKITNPSNTIVWKISSHPDGDHSIYNEASAKYVSYPTTGSTNIVNAVNAISGGSERWNFSYSSNLFVIRNVSTSARYLQYNQSANRFACYKNTLANVTLYKLNSGNCPDWCNLESPATGTITSGGAFNVYAHVYEAGVTPGAGQGSGVRCWIGVSTQNTDPATWTNWIEATYQGEAGNNDEFVANIGAGLSPGTYYYASRFTVDGACYSYGGYNGGTWNGTSNVSGVLTVNPNYPDWCNLQTPSSGPIYTGGEYIVYARVYEAGVTNGEGQGAGISCQIGYSTSNTNPADWTTWVPASYNVSYGDNDEYRANIGPLLSPGTYYYASRFTLDGVNYSYGGYNITGGGFWDASTNTSQQLTVNTNYPEWCNLQWPSNGAITQGTSFDVYAQVWEPGVTNSPGQGTNVQGWIGFSTSNTNPATWTNWIEAVYNGEDIHGNNDEFKAEIGSALSPGTYYYASRFKVNPNADEYAYGGYSPTGGNIWDGTGNVSGVLVVTKPVITLSGESLSGFYYYEGSGPSGHQSFTISGADMIGDISLTAPAAYEISTSEGSGYASSLSLTNASGTIAATTIYARLKAGLAAGTYNNQLITASSNNATSVTISCSGTVYKSAPTEQASLIVFSNVSYSSMSLSWTNGNGASRIVIANTTNSFTDPANGTDPSANAVYGGTGEQVVYNGTGNTVNITGLDEATTYWFRVYEYNNSGVYTLYNTSTHTGNPNSETTTIAPCIDQPTFASTPSGWAATNITYVSGEANFAQTTGSLTTIAVSNPTLLTFDLRRTTNATVKTLYIEVSTTTQDGTYSIIETYNHDNTTSGGTKQCTVDLSAYSGNPVVYIRFRKQSSTTSPWYLKKVIVLCNPVGCEVPTIQSTTAGISMLSKNTAELSWTSGDGENNLVVIKQGSAVDGFPTDNTSYEASASFGEGTEIGSGNYVAYAGSGNSIALSNLTGGTTYHIAVFSYNCNNGFEKYLTTGAATISFTTLIEQAGNLRVSCSNATSASLSWDAPAGITEGVIIAMKSGTTDVPDISGLPTDYLADATYGLGSSFGPAGDLSYVVYKGTATSVDVSGLTANGNYRIRAFAFRTNEWATDIESLEINNLGIPEVSNLQGAGQATGATLSWGNPEAACFDEIVIVAHTASIGGVPSGTYTAHSGDYLDASNPTFPGGGIVVYNGTGDTQAITGLTNGIPYYFKVFVRKDNTWSAGKEITVIPTGITYLNYGDVAILGINTQFIGSSIDHVAFVIFANLTPNSSLDFTDNGYEFKYPGLWGTSEGVIRLKRINTTLPAGTVVTVTGSGTSFEIYTNGARDTDWEVSSLNGTSSFDLNTEDQIWIMQGGEWSSAGQYKGSYSGKVLYGWTATGWKTEPGYNNTKGSTLYPSAGCTSTNVIDLSYKDKVKYTGTTDIANKYDWIGRINDNTNWTGFGDNTTYTAGGSYGYLLSISPSVEVGNKWLGSVSTDWFDCANWGGLRVPDEYTDVVIDDVAISDILINGQTAYTKALQIDNELLSITVGPDPASRLSIHGNLTISSIMGFTHSGGDIEMAGSYLQTVSGDIPYFNNLIINNPNGVTFGSEDILVEGTLTLSKGALTASYVWVANPDPLAIVSPSATSYINAELERNVTVPNAYNLPLGNNGLKQNARINLISSSGLTSISASFNGEIGNTDITSQNLSIDIDGNLSPLHTLLDAGFWTISPNNGGTANYDIQLSLAGSTNMGINAAQHTILKRNNPTANWELQGIHNNNTQSISGNTLTAVRTGLTSFSDFAIAKNDQSPLPVELLFFNAELKEQKAELHWATASETNNHYFTVERSHDGRLFEDLVTVSGHGTSNEEHSYNFTDYSPILPLSYYRLRQTDYDGTNEYSGIVKLFEQSSLQSQSLKIESVRLDINKDANIIVSGSRSEQLILNVYSVSGAVIFRAKFNTGQAIILPGQYVKDQLIIIEITDGFSRASRKVTGY